MNAYLQWNDAIATRFFNQDMAGRNVYMYVNQGLISEMEQELEPEAGKFLDAIKDGPPWADSQSICQCALQAYTNWRDRCLHFPPYIAYLGLFVLAGGADGDFSPNAYYPRLRELLEDSGQGTIPSFHHMWQLWEDLEEWSVFDRKGEFGMFRARIIGRKIHIGYPLAQSMLTEPERKALPRVFYDAGLDPTSAPPADELARALRSPTARSLLRSRTVKLVENQHDVDLYTTMLDTVADELAEWDGDVEDVSPSGLGSRLASASLRLCLDVDGVSGRAKAAIRCKVNREFPEEGLILDIPNLNGRFRAEEYLDGWSLPVRDDNTEEVLDASLLDWHNGLTMRCTSPAWQLKLPRRQIRLFIEGTSEGIPGLVEIHALPHGQSFYLAYPEDSWHHLEPWASSQCHGFREFENVQGLPPAWRFASVKEVTGDEGIKDFLSFPPSVRLRLVGGIRSNRGNNFFNFAPPISIIVEGGASNIDLYCNNQQLLSHGSGGVFAFPQDLPTESRIVIEARSSDSVLARQSLFLTGDFRSGSQETRLSIDSTGSKIEPDSDCLSVAGAYVRGRLPDQPGSAAELLEDLEAEVGSMKGFLIGKLPGQVVEWPSEPFPTDWRPVWAIAKERRKRRATFLGENLESALPSLPAHRNDRKIRTWKQVLWYQRRQIDPPVIPAVCALWKQFQEVARDV